MIFDDKIFEIFDIVGLDNRMDKIRSNIQPLFSYYAKFISKKLGDSYIHIAKHLRRTKHEPESTWVAIGGDKRGYKKYPHFQIGINKEYVFICLSLIDNPLYENEMLNNLLDKIDILKNLSSDYIVIDDHTKIEYKRQGEFLYEEVLKSALKNKKKEFMLGKILNKNDKVLLNEEETKKWILNTVNDLIPFYVDLLKYY